MSDPIDGIYSLYFTSKEDYGTGMLVVRRGKLAGADPSGSKFDGSYSKSSGMYEFNVKVEIPASIELIQGVNSGSGSKYSIYLKFDDLPERKAFIRAETPHGPLNIRFVKLRGLDV